MNKYIIDDYLVFNKNVEKWKNKLSIYQNGTIVINSEKNVELYGIICACIKLKITFVLLDILLPEIRKNSIIKECCPNALIDSNYNIKHIHDNKLNLSNNIAYIIFTSGTTGVPKGIKITYDNLFAFVKSISQNINFKSKTIISFTSISFDIFILESVVALYNKMKIVIVEDEDRINPSKIIRLINESNVNFLQCTPSALKLLLAYDNSFIHNIDELLLGGEKFEYKLLSKIKENFNGILYNLYGPSETTVYVTLKKIDTEITVGKVFDEKNHIYIVDKNLNVLGQNEVGEVLICGICVGENYINENSAFFEFKGMRAFHSGDYGKINTKGELIILDRIDNQIKINGYRIEKEEIENSILNIDGIDDNKIYYDPNEKILIDYYVGKKIDDKFIINYLKKQLPYYMIPHYYVQIPYFIYNNNGKLDIKATYEKFNSIFPSENKKYSDLINFINSIGLIHIDSINVDDTLISKGIDSIVLISILVEIERKYNVNIDTYFDTIRNIIYFKDLYKIFINLQRENNKGETYE